MNDKRDIPVPPFQRTPLEEPDGEDRQCETVLKDGRKYKVTVHYSQGNHATRIYEPIRIPEEQAEWLEKLDRAVRAAFPGWRLRAYQGCVPRRRGRRRESETAAVNCQ